MKSRLLDVGYGFLAIAGLVLLTWAAFHLADAREVQACNQKDCSLGWTVISSTCDDLFRCGCGTNCAIAENTCYRERGYCNGSVPRATLSSENVTLVIAAAGLRARAPMEVASVERLDIVSGFKTSSASRPRAV